MVITLKLDRISDADIIGMMEKQKSAEEYLKRLVREDAARQSGKAILDENEEDLARAEKAFNATMGLLRSVRSK